MLSVEVTFKDQSKDDRASYTGSRVIPGTQDGK